MVNNATCDKMIKELKENTVAENMSNKTKGRPTNNTNNSNVSNIVRTVLLTFVLVCFGAFLITNMNYGQTTEIALNKLP